MKHQSDQFENLLEGVLNEARNLGEDLILKTEIKLGNQAQLESDSTTDRRWDLKERINMKFNMKKPMGLAASVAVTLLFTGISALAMWQWLTPSEVADVFDNAQLSDAFEGEGAIHINDVQYSGGYRFTLMSIVSGRDLSETPIYIEDYLEPDRSYIVIAIEQEDGTSMDESLTTFLASPYVHGFAPWQVNLASLGEELGGGHQEIVVNGVLYRLIETGNVEIFADHGVYLGIGSQTFGAFDFDVTSGAIRVSSEFEGPAVLFEVPFDQALADQERAQAILDQISGEVVEDDGVMDDCVSFDTSFEATHIDADGNEVIHTQEDMNFARMTYDELADFLQERIDHDLANGEPEAVVQGGRRDRERNLEIMRLYNLEFADVWYSDYGMAIDFNFCH